MTLSSQLVQELRAAIGRNHQILAAVDPPRTARCSADECGPHAVTAIELTLDTHELSGVTTFALQAASAQLAQRVNYLLEPIAAIETDAESCTVQMRSKPPQQNDAGRSYYELLLRRGGSITLCRYEKTPGQPRTRVPAVLTYEVVGRLIDDFSATVDAL